MVLPEAVKPATEKQKHLVAALESSDADLVGAFGPTGTGKSFITCLYGIGAVKAGKYTRFVIVRPIREIMSRKLLSSTELGDLYYEMSLSYLQGLVAPYIQPSEVKSLVEDGKIEFVDPNFLIGRTFDKSLVFLDDVQFLSVDVITEALVRVGTDSKLVVAGDPLLQLAPDEKNGAALARELLLGEERAIVVDFGIKDIVRPGAKRGFKLAIEMKLRKRSLNEEEKKVLNVAYTHAPDTDIVTVVLLKDIKEKFGVTRAPDVLIIAKEGYLGRLIGKRGERINKVQDETGYFIRAVELTTELRDIILALHPVGWIDRHIGEVDVAGSNLEVEVNSKEFGAFVGQKGAYVRFLDEAMRRLLGIGIRARSVQMEVKPKKRRRR